MNSHGALVEHDNGRVLFLERAGNGGLVGVLPRHLAAIADARSRLTADLCAAVCLPPVALALLYAYQEVPEASSGNALAALGPISSAPFENRDFCARVLEFYRDSAEASVHETLTTVSAGVPSNTESLSAMIVLLRNIEFCIERSDGYTVPVFTRQTVKDSVSFAQILVSLVVY